MNEDAWRYWGKKEDQGLREVIALADRVFPTCEVAIEGSRHCGLTLLVNGIATARAIRLCLRNDLPGPAFALARTLYESVLRGHIIVHEISMDELNDLLVRIREWRERNSPGVPPPKIELKGKRWRTSVRGTRDDPDFGNRRTLVSEQAVLYQQSVLDMPVLHDLTHGGMTQAMQMMDSEQAIGAHHSVANQTLLLHFATRGAMFAIMTWPGAWEKYEAEIEHAAHTVTDRWRNWEGLARTTPQ